jgi:hypothetical protein
VRAEEFYQLKEELMPEVSKVLLRLHTEKKYGPAHIKSLYGEAECELIAASLLGRQILARRR